MAALGFLLQVIAACFLGVAILAYSACAVAMFVNAMKYRVLVRYLDRRAYEFGIYGALLVVLSLPMLR